MASMETYGQNAGKVKDTMSEKVKNAQEMRSEIDKLKEGLSQMPEGLDAEITSAIDSTLETGRGQAQSDISKETSAASQAQSEGQSVISEINKKISDNAAAQSRMESVRSSKYGATIENAMKAAKDNSKRGEDINKDLQDNMKNSMDALRDAMSGI